MSIEEVKIGDFSRPLVERPVGKPMPEKPDASNDATGAAKEALDKAEAKLDADVNRVEKKLKPQLSYEESLKEIKVTREEAAEIVDSVLLKGCYAEDIAITTRVSVRLRTRQYRDTQRVQAYLEVSRPIYDANVNETIMRYALASSLEKLGKDVLPFPPPGAPGPVMDDAFKERLTFIDNLPEPTYRLLCRKLVAFDNKVSTVLEEGAIENF